MEKEGELMVRGRVEIDTRQPFRSVKEAVMLFGEKFLAEEIYAKQLKETKPSAGQNQPKTDSPVTIELEKTKQNLQKSKEEGTFMAHCLQSLKEELELTKREIQQLKTRELKQKVPLGADPEIEELKFIENSSSSKVELRTQFQEYDNEIEFQKKRSVKFASTPLLTKIINVETKTSPSQLKKKMKKKTLIPFFGGLFSKKKGNQVNQYS
ncbi:WEB family protein At1g75720-like isoform X2 [Nicotiana tabacum]|uniref:WEB family protein At1g75720-like isoform X2 n=2 Tax=Nicotiana TaxID=4085 RepID=A0A1S3YRY4_TOBAC|nr:PREDICTED: WEB family protein At1g75720-like isoform X2 [Nicotiana sylvestris]XP_016454705.1 PREDICTED: WEB family protein At1g75720-like isoform X2 [Nicotiana tabacum]